MSGVLKSAASETGTGESRGHGEGREQTPAAASAI
jgi:hypothetical protein